MTITIDEAVYAGLHKVVGRGNISRFLEDLARPHVMREDSLAEGYQAMAADLEREAGGKKSKAMADQIMTADKKRLKERLGKLSQADIRALEVVVKLQLGIEG